MVTKKKMIAFLIFMAGGQLVALLTWLTFKEAYFTHMIFGSILGFIMGYKEEKPKDSIEK